LAWPREYEGAAEVWKSISSGGKNRLP
jgi:hypothetical protein